MSLAQGGCQPLGCQCVNRRWDLRKSCGFGTAQTFVDDVRADSSQLARDPELLDKRLGHEVFFFRTDETDRLLILTKSKLCTHSSTSLTLRRQYGRSAGYARPAVAQWRHLRFNDPRSLLPDVPGFGRGGRCVAA